MGTPEYFHNSGLFRVSDPKTKVKAGDALYFLADKVCHRAPPFPQVELEQPKSRKGGRQSSSYPPSDDEDGHYHFIHGLDGKRRVLFWFSWDAAVSSQQGSPNEPDLDFQLNPWTLHHLLHIGNNYENDLVICFFISFLSFFSLMCISFSVTL